MPQDADSQLADLLKAAHHIVVFTGAGISTHSGIPDYRGPQGVWQTRQPIYYQAFMSDEAKRLEYWQYKADEWRLCFEAEPNNVHAAVARLEQLGRLDMCVTQNIDGLHSRAGTSRARLVELHGTNLEVECQSCQARSDPAPHFAKLAETGACPMCEACGGILKPATISFGQSLNETDLQRGADAAEACDLMIALGSTLSVYPAAAIPLRAAQRGVPYVVINRGQTDHDGLPQLSLRLEGDVGELFPPAVRALG